MTILGPTSPPRFPIGHSDYVLVRRQDLTYVDKTLWIADVLNNPASVLLVPRPRRFGKTLNMTTLRHFLDRSNDDLTDVFNDTAVWTADGEIYREHFQRYPVIYLTFKDVKHRTWAECQAQLVRVLARAASDLLRHSPGPDDPISGDLTMTRLAIETTSIHVFSDMLLDASRWLHKATGQQVVILIDEYDSPLHAAWQHGYWDEAVAFFRHFFSAGLKDNPHVKKGVLTGILKVAKEGIFSGLNHLLTASILSDSMLDKFGFTEEEVTRLAENSPAPQAHDLSAMQHWYNGYRFGEFEPQTIYNPWSVLSYLQQPGSGPRAFWKNTSDNALIRNLLMRHAATVGPDIETLLTGGTLDQLIDENVALTQLDDKPEVVWGLLLFSGYLTAAHVQPTDDGPIVTLRIPNREVRSVYTETFRQWIEAAAGYTGPATLRHLVTALLCGDADIVDDALGTILSQMLSFHDLGGKAVEAVYQAFIVGMLIHLQPTHRVYSNREAGLGRADVLIVPRTPGPGAVLELKRILSRETPEQALDRACAQLIDRDYASEVRAGGATSVFQYGVVFDGKRCWVKVVSEGAG